MKQIKNSNSKKKIQRKKFKFFEKIYQKFMNSSI